MSGTGIWERARKYVVHTASLADGSTRSHWYPFGVDDDDPAIVAANCIAGAGDHAGWADDNLQYPDGSPYESARHREAAE